MEPTDTYRDIYRQGISLKRRKWIVQPDWVPPSIGGMEKAGDLLEKHFLPRMWSLLADFHQQLQTGTYFVKGPNWMEPPITARNLDKRTETAVLLTAGAGDVVVKEFVMPDRWVGCIRRLGHELTDAAFWGTVKWTIRINNNPVENYEEFLQQIGMFVDPGEIPIFPPLKSKDKIQWIANNPGPGNVSALARFWGFMFPAQLVTQDGSFREYETR
jgi:hypothetical protein